MLGSGFRCHVGQGDIILLRCQRVLSTTAKLTPIFSVNIG